MRRGRDHPQHVVLKYILLTVFILTTGLALAWIAINVLPRTSFYRVSDDDFAKWFGLVVCTPVLFGLVIQWNGRLWRNRIFWNTLAILFVAHIVLFVVAFRIVVHWRVIWTSLAISPEAALISATVDWAAVRFGRHHNSKRMATHR